MNLIKTGSLFVAIVLLLTSFSKPDQPSKPDKPDPNFHLYLLVGQSNMAGRGVNPNEYRDISQPKILMLNKEGKWVTASHPLHFDKPAIAGVGPGLAVGLEMAKANPGVR